MRTGDRKPLGAFYTPPSLATFLADWAVIGRSSRILEPSVGDGALAHAIVERFQRLGGGCLVGYEIDPATAERSSRRFKGGPVRIVEGDFLEDEIEAASFDAVVANPPFTRNHSLSESQKNRLRARFGPAFGIRGAPGLWVYFLCACLPLLARGGRIAFVAPGAAAFADYARPVLKILKERFATVEILRAQSAVQWEGEAEERPALILASGYGEGPSENIQYNSLVEPSQGTFARTPMASPAPVVSHQTLGELAQIEIGVVTGLNRTFLMNAHEIDEFEVPPEDLTPIIARARHVQGLWVTTRDLVRLAQAGERTFLLTPGDFEKRGSGARNRLATIPARLRRTTVWFSKRQPWWKIQVGQQPDAVFTYMNHIGPRLAVVHAPITSTNTLHKVMFKNRSAAHIRTACVSILSTYTQLHAERIGRVYGGGVLKFELAEARRLPLLIPAKPIDLAIYRRIDTALRSGAPEQARELADKAVLPHFFGELWAEMQNELNRQLQFARLSRGLHLR